MPGEKCTLSHFLMSELIAWLGEQTERAQACDTAGDMAQPKNPGKNTSTFQSSIKSREKGINQPTTVKASNAVTSSQLFELIYTEMLHACIQRATPYLILISPSIASSQTLAK